MYRMVKNVVVKNVLFKLIHAPVVLTTSLCHCLWLSWFQSTDMGFITTTAGRRVCQCLPVCWRPSSCCHCGTLVLFPNALQLDISATVSRNAWQKETVHLGVIGYAFLIPTTISSWDRVFFGRRCLLPCTLGTRTWPGSFHLKKF